MDKSTLQIAEQVGLFLLPVVRGIISEVLTKAAAEAAERTEALAVELRGAMTTEHARNLETLQGVSSRLEKQIEQLAGLQRDSAGALQSKASTDQLEALAAQTAELGRHLAEAQTNVDQRFAGAAVYARESRGIAESTGASIAEVRELLLKDIGYVSASLSQHMADAAARTEKLEQRLTETGDTTRGTIDSIHIETRALRTAHAELAARVEADSEATTDTLEKTKAAFDVVTTNVDKRLKDTEKSTIEAVDAVQMHLQTLRTMHGELAASVEAHSERIDRLKDASLEVWEVTATNTEQRCKQIEASTREAMDAMQTHLQALRTLHGELAARVASDSEASMRDIEKIDTETEARLRAYAADTTQQIAGIRDTVSTAWKEIIELRTIHTALSSRIDSSSELAMHSLEEQTAELWKNIATLTEGIEQRFGVRDADAVTNIAGVKTLVEQRHAEMLEHVAEVTAAIPRIDNAVVGESFRAMVEHETAAALPVIQRNLSAFMREQIAVAVEALPRPKDGADGLLPVADPYIEGDAYGRGAVVLHAGGMWQATRRTKAAPGGKAGGWQALAVGVAGVSFAATEDLRGVELAVELSDGAQVRSTVGVPAMVYRDVYADDKTYTSHDVVTHDGSLWISRCTDNAGVQPGTDPDKWRLIVKRGQPGKHGKDAVPPPPVTVERSLYAGEYEEGKVYGKDSVVEYASSLWMAKRPTKERPPYLANKDNDHWLRLR